MTSRLEEKFLMSRCAGQVEQGINVFQMQLINVINYQDLHIGMWDAFQSFELELILV